MPTTTDHIAAACEALKAAGWVCDESCRWMCYRKGNCLACVWGPITKFFQDGEWVRIHRTTATASIARTARRLAREHKGE
jgi:hypothetical protein